MDKLSFYAFFASLVAALSGFLFGYHTGIISGAMLFIAEQFHLTVLEQGLIVSAILIGGAAGALFGGCLSDAFGRKKILFLTIFLFFIATYYLYDAQSYCLVMSGRIIAGLGIGIGSVAAPLYIAEISPKTCRGALVSLNQLMITIGILFAFIVSWLYTDAADWRAMFMVGVIPAALQGMGLFFIPESPAWLSSRQKMTDAKKALYRLKIDSGCITTPDSFSVQKKMGVLFTPSVRVAFLVGVGLSLLQQVSGVNTIIYYAPHIFRLAGFASAKSAIYATAWIGCINVFVTLLGLWLVDKVGRRVLLLISLLGMAFSLGSLGAAFILFSAEAGIAAILSLLIYIVSFAIGMGGVPWLIISEIYPLGVRGRAMSITIFFNWVSNYLVTLFFLPLVHWIGIGETYWLFTAVCLAGFWFVWKKIPETRGKTFEEIQNFWHK
jgi:SP family galactose:H+ symporter-like MFS transporter